MQGELAIGTTHGYRYGLLPPYHHSLYHRLSAIMKRPGQNSSSSIKKSWCSYPALPCMIFHSVFDVIPPLEALHTPSGVNDSLLTGEKRMALAADLHLKQGLRRAGGEGIAAGTNHFRFHILGMNLLFHLVSTP